MSEPIDGWTFAVYMMGLFLAVAAFGAFQVWRLMFSAGLGTDCPIALLQGPVKCEV